MELEEVLDDEFTTFIRDMRIDQNYLGLVEAYSELKDRDQRLYIELTMRRMMNFTQGKVDFLMQGFFRA